MLTDDGEERGMNQLIRDPEQVPELVGLLADPAADLARLIHRDRPWWDESRRFLDHDVYATVQDGFGYLSHQDSTRDKAYPVGDPSSEGCEFDDDEFPPGSGLPLEAFTLAISEFLRTAERPTAVTWREFFVGPSSSGW
ncbi:hypothetical protein GCM10023222_27430 [Saccharopolyspora cebuensis]